MNSLFVLQLINNEQFRNKYNYPSFQTQTIILKDIRIKAKSMRIITILICLSLIACGIQKQASEDLSAKTETDTIVSAEKKVRDCFAGYKSAILNDKGEEAVEFVDSRTIKYYSNILEKTKNADSTEIEDLNVMNKLMVFTVRHRTSKEDVLSFDGKRLLVYAIKEGMVGKSSVANIEIGELSIDEQFAKGQLIANGTPAPAYFHFYEEDGAWKIDLTSIFPTATQAFQQMLDESGEDENEYLFMLLEMVTGEKPNENIWKPIK